MSGIQLLDNSEALTRVVERLDTREWIVVDTEFLRDSTYTAKLCIVQLADEEEIDVVDACSLDLSPLKPLFDDSRVEKVMHAAYQDLEVLYQLLGNVPAPVFDTQYAAALLGYDHQIGYAGLVKEILGVELDKSHTRTDWSERPLSMEQLRYAADDVRYLRELYPILKERLEERGRLEWLREDAKKFADPTVFETASEDAWKKVKGAGKLRGLQVAALHALANWREDRARQEDRPRRWILKDEAIVELAEKLPASPAALETMRELPPKVKQRRGKYLLEVIEQVRRLPESDWPEPLSSRMPREVEKKVQAVAKKLQSIAEAHTIHPSAIANRKELERLVLGERSIPLLHGWRYEIAGSELLRELEAPADAG